jgi:hypothetical protein
MKLRFGSARLTGAAALVLGATATMSTSAGAAGTIKNADDHPHYTAEIEPHLIFGTNDYYWNSGVGIGGRFSFVIVDPGFIKDINNTVAIGTGLDVNFYGWDCPYYYRPGPGPYYNCGGSVTGFTIPVVMQWNFYVAPHVSVFGEPGLAIHYYSYSYDCPPGYNCPSYSHTHVAPFVLYGGMRYHFNESIAITPRLGFDNYGAFYLSFGVSFFVGGK